MEKARDEKIYERTKKSPKDKGSQEICPVVDAPKRQTWGSHGRRRESLTRVCGENWSREKAQRDFREERGLLFNEFGRTMEAIP